MYNAQLDQQVLLQIRVALALPIFYTSKKHLFKDVNFYILQINKSLPLIFYS